MKFAIYFASLGRYLSQNLHRVVNEIICKAMASFAATGMDPYRYDVFIIEIISPPSFMKNFISLSPELDPIE
ncbi:hypothetical protein LguiB_027296 [Lonicera macranthoides]